jgi:hypothetical protein
MTALRIPTLGDFLVFCTAVYLLIQLLRGVL